MRRAIGAVLLVVVHAACGQSSQGDADANPAAGDGGPIDGSGLDVRPLITMALCTPSETYTVTEDDGDVFTYTRWFTTVPTSSAPEDAPAVSVIGCYREWFGESYEWPMDLGCPGGASCNHTGTTRPAGYCSSLGFSFSEGLIVVDCGSRLQTYSTSTGESHDTGARWSTVYVQQ